MWRIFIGSISKYLWIADWNAFWIAYDVKQFLRIVYSVKQFLGIAYVVNQFLGIAYGVNQFLGIRVCIIADCLLDGKPPELFHRFCMNVCRNSSLICQVCIFILCIDSYRGLKQSIHSNFIDVKFGIFLFLFRSCHEYDN